MDASSNPKHNSLKNNIIFGLGCFGIAFLLGTLAIIPILNKQEDIGQGLKNVNVDNQLKLSDEIPPDAPAYNIHHVPNNSFGVQEFKTLNTTTFWNRFNSISAWQLEAQHPISGEWIDNWEGENLNNWLDITKTRDISNSSEKINLTVTNNHPTQALRFRFTFGIDSRVKSYVNKSSWYEYELTYSANETENYTVFFNFSDVKPLIQDETLTANHGIKNIDGNDYFWFRLIQNESRLLNAGNSFTIDPDFGDKETGNQQAIGLFAVHYMHGAWYEFDGDTGSTLDSISVYMGTMASTQDFSCAVYEYDDYSSTYVGDLIDTTETLEVTSSDDDTVFDFEFDTPPELTNGVKYYLLIRQHADGGTNYVGAKQSGGYNHGVKTIADADSWASPFTGEIPNQHYMYYIYGTYTEPSAEWQTIDNTFDGVFTNSTSWYVIDNTFDGIYINTTYWNTIDFHFDGEFTNTSVGIEWQTIDNTFDGIFTNSTSWNVIDNTFDGIFTNSTSWNVIDNTFDGIFTNSTSWNVIDNTFDGIFTNSTSWYVIDNTFDGIFTNSTSWYVIDNTFDGIFTNSTSWYVIDNTYNGIFTNSTSWYVIDNTYNGIFTNSTSWNVIDNTYNGIFTNSTSWYVIDNTYNGIFTNSTSWYVIDNTYNGLFQNSTSWKTIEENIYNGVFTNASFWNTIDNTYNGLFQNSTSWNIIDNTFDGIFQNSTSWNVIDNTFDGVFTNSTSWYIIDNTYNGVFTNTSWYTIDNTYNGIFNNLTILYWQTIDNTYNGIFQNTSWYTIDNTYNGIFTNTTPEGVCNCSDFFNESELIEWLEDNGYIKESDDMQIALEVEQLSIFLTLVLFMYFFFMGYTQEKNTGGFLMFISGFIFLALDFIITPYVNSELVAPFLGFVGIFIIIMGLIKWLYWDEDEEKINFNRKKSR